MKISKYVLPILWLVFPLCALAGPVNINTADAETIAAELKGVGLSKACLLYTSPSPRDED